MGIFSGLFRSRDKPTDSTVGSRYAFYMGGSSSGKVVTERSAMQMTAVYAISWAGTVTKVVIQPNWRYL